MSYLSRYQLFFIVFSFKFLLSPLSVLAQLNLNCGGVNQEIPLFKEDSTESFSSQDMVKRKALEPITESSSDFEIRIYIWSIIKNYDEAIVIKCINNKIYADRFQFITSFGSNSYQEFSKDKTYKNISGTFHEGEGNCWLKKTAYVKLNNISSWNSFFSILIKNHLYDMPSEKEFNKIMHSHYPNIVAVNKEGGYYVELKVGNHYRNFINLSDYSNPIPTNEKIYNSRITVFNLFNQINFMR